MYVELHNVRVKSSGCAAEISITHCEMLVQFASGCAAEISLTHCETLVKFASGCTAEVPITHCGMLVKSASGCAAKGRNGCCRKPTRADST